MRRRKRTIERSSGASSGPGEMRWSSLASTNPPRSRRSRRPGGSRGARRGPRASRPAITARSPARHCAAQLAAPRGRDTMASAAGSAAAVSGSARRASPAQRRAQRSSLLRAEQGGADEAAVGGRRRDDHLDLVGELVGERLLDQQGVARISAPSRSICSVVALPTSRGDRRRCRRALARLGLAAGLDAARLGVAPRRR